MEKGSHIEEHATSLMAHVTYAVATNLFINSKLNLSAPTSLPPNHLTT